MDMKQEKLRWDTLHKSAFVQLELSKLQEVEWMKQSPDLLSVHLQPENQQ